MNQLITRPNHLWPFAATCFLATAMTALAHDHSNLEGGIPLEIEDSYAAPWLNREFQLAGYFERTRGGEDRWFLEPRVEFGLPIRNMEVTLAFPFEFGSSVNEDALRNVGIELFYNFNTESRYVPAISVSGRADFPTGNGPEGVDTRCKFIATKTLGRSPLLQRAYLNVEWMHNDDPKRNERDDRYKIVLGYAVHAGADTMILADYVHEQEIERGMTSNLAEVGLRRMLNPLTLVAIGAGVGLDRDSPDFRIRFGFQKNF